MFNKETEYALRGLVYVQMQNNKGRRPGITEIAKEIEAPHHFTAKILQRLVRQGFISSVKGKGGGFFFEKDKPELSLKELVTSIEGPKTFTGCGFGFKQCDGDNPCPLHDRFIVVREALYDLVTKETIQSLAQKIS
ncbi:MAG: Rrf2 family transcriptional regulator [Bacteroidales bacterium]